MEISKLISILRRHDAGCYGCGYEHNCNHGNCALMIQAADALESLSRNSVSENKPLTLEQLR